MKMEQERVEGAENLRNTPIEDIIREQNLPVPVEHWVKSSIMVPMQYLAAMVYYFVYAEANPQLTITNKGVAENFSCLQVTCTSWSAARNTLDVAKEQGRRPAC